MSRCPGSKKSQFLGSQKSIILHFSDCPSVLKTRTHLSQKDCFIPQTPLRATKQSGRAFAFWFHFQQAQTLSEKYVAKPLVNCGEVSGWQAMLSFPMLVRGAFKLAYIQRALMATSSAAITSTDLINISYYVNRPSNAGQINQKRNLTKRDENQSMSHISGIILLEEVRYCIRCIVLKKDYEKQLIKQNHSIGPG